MSNMHSLWHNQSESAERGTPDVPVKLQLSMNRDCSSCKAAWLPQADRSVPVSSVLLK